MCSFLTKTNFFPGESYCILPLEQMESLRWRFLTLGCNQLWNGFSPNVSAGVLYDNLNILIYSFYFHLYLRYLLLPFSLPWVIPFIKPAGSTVYKIFQDTAFMQFYSFLVFFLINRCSFLIFIFQKKRFLFIWKSYGEMGCDSDLRSPGLLPKWLQWPELD